MSLDDCYEVAQETLKVMDIFSKNIPDIFKFPPRIKIPQNCESELLPTVSEPSFVARSETYTPKTEKDQHHDVVQHPLIFEMIDNTKEHKQHLSQNVWSFENVRESEEGTEKDDDWTYMRERAKLREIKQKPTRKSSSTIPPKPTRPTKGRPTDEELIAADMKILNDIKSKVEEYISPEYKLQTGNPLFDK